MPKATLPETQNNAAVVLADTPKRTALRGLQSQLDALRDDIATADLEIETLREQLASFESEYHAKLAKEHHELGRVEALVRHAEHWMELLQKKPAEGLAGHAKRLEKQRASQIRHHATEPEPQEETADVLPLEARDERLKAAYRALARRYHPDLASSENERVEAGAMMTRINELYRLGDIDRLVALREPVKGGEIEDSLGLDEQIEVLAQRLDWFEAALANLREERVALERSPTWELWRNVEQVREAGRDLIAELREQLRVRVANAYGDVRLAAKMLEDEVTRYNKRAIATATGGKSLQRGFDPLSDKKLVRLGLEHLETTDVSSATRRRGEEIATWAEQAPHLLTLALFTYASEMSPFPFEGMATYDDLSLRFDAMVTGKPISLEQTLVEAAPWASYAIKHATARVAYVGLRFVDTRMALAVSVALQRFSTRRCFAKVLGVLGEQASCDGCGKQIFAVPLFKSRGLDDLRALVCPLCGHILKSYWMPAGKDIQSVLNPTFLDYELLSEWTFKIARQSAAVQLVPCQVDTMTLGALKRQLVADLFKRHDLEILPAHVQLLQGKKTLGDRKRLRDLDSRTFLLRFNEDAPMREAEALEIVRHRIRDRFRTD